jgi:telomerase reverse transcriptase
MKYIFPRQFGLQDIFTCDNIEYSKNYMDREDEISELEARKQTRKSQLKSTLPVNEDRDSPKLPKRLRGTAGELVQRLRNRHARCSYGELLKHYCPSDVSICRLVFTPSLTIAGNWTRKARPSFADTIYERRR